MDMNRPETVIIKPAPGSAVSPLFLALYLCFAGTAPAPAAISAGGGYLLESSVQDNGGGGLQSGGGYAAWASAGQRLAAQGPGIAAWGGYVNRSGFYNPPHFTFQKGLASAAAFASGAASVLLPAGAVDKEVFDIGFNRTPVYTDPALVESASGKLEANEGAWARLLRDNLTETVFFDEQDAWRGPFARGGLLTMRYKDDDGDGNLDGSAPPVRADTVKLWVLDEALSMWAKLPASDADRAARSVTVPFLAPGVYALLGQVDESVKDTYAFPVPFRPGGPNAGAGAGQTGTEADGVTFANVPQTGDIEIYTLDGRLVKKLPIPAGLIIPKLKWDVRTAGGARAASGVYIWRVVSGANSRTGKLMVIW